MVISEVIFDLMMRMMMVMGVGILFPFGKRSRAGIFKDEGMQLFGISVLGGFGGLSSA